MGNEMSAEGQPQNQGPGNQWRPQPGYQGPATHFSPSTSWTAPQQPVGYQGPQPVAATVTGGAKAAAPDVDMSHLSDEERAVIASVMARANGMEDSAARRKDAAVRRSGQGQGPRRACPICHMNEVLPVGAGGQPDCADCKSRVCPKCGTNAPTSDSKRPEWLCNICLKKRTVMASSSLVYGHQGPQPSPQGYQQQEKGRDQRLLDGKFSEGGSCLPVSPAVDPLARSVDVHWTSAKGPAPTPIGEEPEDYPTTGTQSDDKRSLSPSSPVPQETFETLRDFDSDEGGKEDTEEEEEEEDDDDDDDDEEEEETTQSLHPLSYLDHSPGEVYTIPEEEEEASSPTGRDGVTSLARWRGMAPNQPDPKPRRLTNNSDKQIPPSRQEVQVRTTGVVRQQKSLEEVLASQRRQDAQQLATATGQKSTSLQQVHQHQQPQSQPPLTTKASPTPAQRATPKQIDLQQQQQQQQKSKGKDAQDWSPVTDLSPIMDVSPSLEAAEQEMMERFKVATHEQQQQQQQPPQRPPANTISGMLADFSKALGLSGSSPRPSPGEEHPSPPSLPYPSLPHPSLPHPSLPHPSLPHPSIPHPAASSTGVRDMEDHNSKKIHRRLPQPSGDTQPPEQMQPQQQQQTVQHQQQIQNKQEVHHYQSQQISSTANNGTVVRKDAQQPRRDTAHAQQQQQPQQQATAGDVLQSPITPGTLQASEAAAAVPLVNHFTPSVAVNRGNVSTGHPQQTQGTSAGRGGDLSDSQGESDSAKGTATKVRRKLPPLPANQQPSPIPTRKSTAAMERAKRQQQHQQQTFEPSARTSCSESNLRRIALGLGLSDSPATLSVLRSATSASNLASLGGTPVTMPLNGEGPLRPRSLSASSGTWDQGDTYLQTLQQQQLRDELKKATEDRRRRMGYFDRDLETRSLVDAMAHRQLVSQEKQDSASRIAALLAARTTRLPQQHATKRGHRRQLSDSKISPIREDDYFGAMADFSRRPFEYESIDDELRREGLLHLPTPDLFPASSAAEISPSRHGGSTVGSRPGDLYWHYRRTPLATMVGPTTPWYLQQQQQQHLQLQRKSFARVGSHDGSFWNDAHRTLSEVKPRKPRSWHPSPYASEDEEDEEQEQEELMNREEKKRKIKAEIARRRWEIDENARLHEQLLRLASNRRASNPYCIQPSLLDQEPDPYYPDPMSAGTGGSTYNHSHSMPALSSIEVQGHHSTADFRKAGSLLKSIDEILRYDSNFSRPTYEVYGDIFASTPPPAIPLQHALPAHPADRHCANSPPTPSGGSLPPFSSPPEEPRPHDLIEGFRTYQSLQRRPPAGRTRSPSPEDRPLTPPRTASPGRQQLRQHRHDEVLEEDLDSRTPAYSPPSQSPRRVQQPRQARRSQRYQQQYYNYPDGSPAATDTETPTDFTPAMPLLPDMPSRSRKLLEDLGSRPIAAEPRQRHPGSGENRNRVQGKPQQQPQQPRGHPQGQLKQQTQEQQRKPHPSDPQPAQRYNFPTKRILLTKDPKDRSVNGNGLGMRVIGGKHVPGSGGEIGAYVAKIYPGGVVETLGEVKEGDQVLEWNGISLTGKTYEEVQRIVAKSDGEMEIVIRSDINMNPVTGVNGKVGRAPTKPPRKPSTYSWPQNGNGNPSPPPKDPKREQGTEEEVSRREDPKNRNPEKIDGKPEHGVAPRNVPALGSVQLQVCYDVKAFILYVTVIRAENLTSTRNPSDPRPDPFVKCYLLPGRNVENQRRTRNFPQTRDPEWKQTMVYPNVSAEELRLKYLEITVWSYDMHRANEFLGEIILDLSEDMLFDEEPRWFRLREHDDNLSKNLLEKMRSKAARSDRMLQSQSDEVIKGNATTAAVSTVGVKTKRFGGNDSQGDVLGSCPPSSR